MESNVFAIPNLDFTETDNTNLLINPENNIYSSFISKISLTSSSFNTLTTDCLFNLGSLDQIGVLSSDNDKANKGASFRCGDILLASGINSSYSSFGMGLTNSKNKLEKKNKTTSSLNLDCLEIMGNLDLISSNTSCGQNNLIPLSYSSKIISKTLPLIIPDIKTLVSNISIYNSCLLATPSFINSLNSCALFSDNLDLEAIVFNNLFCNSTLAHCSNDFNIRSSAITALANLCASCAYSSGTSNFKLSSFINNKNNENYKKLSINKFGLNRIINTYTQLKNLIKINSKNLLNQLSNLRGNLGLEFGRVFGFIQNKLNGNILAFGGFLALFSVFLGLGNESRVGKKKKDKIIQQEKE